MATLRHKRGYAFEKYITKNINDQKWDSRILGGASSGLPDVVATNNFDSILFSIEAKSTVGNKLNIPQDEFERCAKILSWLSTYENKYIVLAFKFGAGKVGSKLTQRKKEDVKFYYYLVSAHWNTENLKYIYCNDQGKLWWTSKNKDKRTNQPKLEYEMFTSITELKNPSIPLTNCDFRPETP